jgi:2-aminoadipate transaminase
MIAPDAPRQRHDVQAVFSDAHTSNLSQAIAAHYLTLGRMDADTRRGAQDLCRTRPRHGRMPTQGSRQRDQNSTQPQGGMFFWAKLTEGRNANEFAQRAMKSWWRLFPAHPSSRATPTCRRCGFRLLPQMWRRLKKGLGGWGGRCEKAQKPNR